jgi:predicted CXXCH cytochrome family protein
MAASRGHAACKARQRTGGAGSAASAWLRARRLRGFATLALAFALSPAAMAQSRTPQPVIEPARAGTQCVADPATMRRDHPSMLKHQRDDTVHGGIRGAKASLKECIACHASPASGSVAKSETNFCVACHSYAAVTIDCFECHTSKAQTVASQGMK